MGSIFKKLGTYFQKTPIHEGKMWYLSIFLNLFLTIFNPSFLIFYCAWKFRKAPKALPHNGFKKARDFQLNVLYIENSLKKSKSLCPRVILTRALGQTCPTGRGAM